MSALRQAIAAADYDHAAMRLVAGVLWALRTTPEARDALIRQIAPAEVPVEERR